MIENRLSKNDMGSRLMVTIVAILVLSAGLSACAEGITTVPDNISMNCRQGTAKIYDECSDQEELLDTALQKAESSDKSVLVVYGAEWCIWCHVFDKYVRGESRDFEYKWQYHDGENLQWEMFEIEGNAAEKQASRLKEFVTQNFVILYLESYYSPNGQDTLAGTGFDAESVKVVPQILVLDSNGMYAAKMDDYTSIANLEIREDSGEEYRGFDRLILLEELRELRNQALRNKEID